MDDRYGQLLICLVREYIRTAEPQGSRSLLIALGWPVSSATIRTMLRDLEEEGYITQPHTSAGRIPTDAGYRYYVNSLIVRDMRSTQLQRLAREYQQLRDEYEFHNHAAAKLLARLVRSMAVGGHLPSRDIYGTGYGALFEGPEAESLAAMREVSALLDSLDEHVDRFADDDSANVTTYIGQENPALRQAEHVSVMARTVPLPRGGQVVLIVVGPKRMPYDRHIAALNGVASIIGDNNS